MPTTNSAHQDELYSILTGHESEAITQETITTLNPLISVLAPNIDHTTQNLMQQTIQRPEGSYVGNESSDATMYLLLVLLGNLMLILSIGAVKFCHNRIRDLRTEARGLEEGHDNPAIEPHNSAQGRGANNNRHDRLTSSTQPNVANVKPGHAPSASRGDQRKNASAEATTSV